MQCGACWATAAVEAVEGAYQIATNQTLILSVEQVLDCDKTSSYCQGG